MQKTTGVVRRKPRPFRKRSEWEMEVSMWRESGQALKDYAEAHDLHSRTLAWWAAFLKKGVNSRSVTPSRSKEKRFIPVRVVDDRSLAEKPISSDSPMNTFEVFNEGPRFGSGTFIVVHVEEREKLGCVKCRKDVVAVSFDVFARSLIGADDSHLKTLDKSHKHGVFRGYIWSFVGTDGVVGELETVAYAYTKSWNATEVVDLFSSINGFIQCDGYAGYSREVEDVDNGLILSINPHEYLVNLIARLESGWPMKRLFELTPANWLAQKTAQ